MRRLLPLLFLLTLAAPVRAEITAVVWSAEMRPYVTDWQTEVARRYDDAVVVFCHGDDREGRWVFVPDRPWAVEPVADAIVRLRRSPVVGSRRIVLVTCNPGGYALPRESGPVTFLSTPNLIRFRPDKSFVPAVWSRPYTGNVFELAEQD
jgi:hypothetical protein